jgi:4'-phosphopantetheinyl transferase
VNIYWLGQTAQDVPAGGNWLGPSESLRQDALRFPKRRAAWRWGRWTAKCAVSGYLNLDQDQLSEVEILPAPSGAPEVFIANRPAPVTISLSHSGATGFCVVAEPGVELGCDLEIVEPRGPAFLTDYFTEEEQSLVRQTPPAERDRLLTLLWSAKESVLKALRCGLRSDTLAVSTVPSAPSAVWNRFSSRHTSGRIFSRLVAGN